MRQSQKGARKDSPRQVGSVQGIFALVVHEIQWIWEGWDFSYFTSPPKPGFSSIPKFCRLWSIMAAVAPFPLKVHVANAPPMLVKRLQSSDLHNSMSPVHLLAKGPSSIGKACSTRQRLYEAIVYVCNHVGQSPSSTFLLCVVTWCIDQCARCFQSGLRYETVFRRLWGGELGGKPVARTNLAMRATMRSKRPMASTKAKPRMA